MLFKPFYDVDSRDNRIRESQHGSTICFEVVGALPVCVCLCCSVHINLSLSAEMER